MKKYIYESPDKGKTVYRREFGKIDRELVVKKEKAIIEQCIDKLQNHRSSFK